jgi:hypothetical protein
LNRCDLKNIREMDKAKKKNPSNTAPSSKTFRDGMTNSDKVLFGKAKWKRPLRKPRCRWRNNIKMDLKETVWKIVDWIHLAQDRVQRRYFVNTVMELRSL